MPSVTAVLGKAVKGASGRESYLPAILRSGDDAKLVAEPLKWGGSSDFVAFARATDLIIIPADAGMVEAGTLVKTLRLPVNCTV